MNAKTKPNAKGKRGFFFTVMALAILSFMLLTVQVWVKTFEQSDQRASERFKGESMRLVFATISDKSFSDFANASAFYALYRLDNYTSVDTYALKSEPAADEALNPGTGQINETIYGLMSTGYAQPVIGAGQKAIQYTPSEIDNYTFVSWEDRINKSAALMGFNVIAKITDAEQLEAALSKHYSVEPESMNDLLTEIAGDDEHIAGGGRRSQRGR